MYFAKWLLNIVECVSFGASVGLVGWVIGTASSLLEIYSSSYPLIKQQMNNEIWEGTS